MIGQKIKVMSLIVSMALLALPVYVFFAIVMIPIGIGLIMVTSSSPWILNLYPFVYASTGHWKEPIYFFENSISIPLTMMQWIVIAWIGSFFLREMTWKQIVLRTCAILLIVGVATSIILSVIGVKLMWTAAHT